MQTLFAILTKISVGALLLGAISTAQAQVHEFTNCTLNPGKTPEDAARAFGEFQVWLDANAKRTRPAVSEMLWEFYSDDTQGGTGFVLHFVWNDFEKLGNALNERWDKGGYLKEPQDDTFTCAGSRIFWSNPQQ